MKNTKKKTSKKKKSSRKIKEEPLPSIYYAYPTLGKNRYSVVAVQVEGMFYTMGVARTSAKDKFNRKFGRMIAERRAKSRNHFVPPHGIKNVRDFLHAIDGAIDKFDNKYLGKFKQQRIGSAYYYEK